MSTTYRLAAELVAWGALERPDGGPGYRLGPRLSELGAMAPRARTLREVAAPFMRDLHAATQEDVQLTVLDGPAARVVERVPGGGLPAPWAGAVPLHATAVGKVLLAHEELALGSSSVAAPVVAADSTVVAALAIAVRTQPADVDRLGPAVRTTAISISRSWQERAPAVGLAALG
jgi:DNA-binding IclR family transcriptional regulator